MRRREIGKVGERPVAARGDDAVDRLAADAAQRRERVVDGVAVDVEVDARAVDRRRLDLDAEPLGLGAEFGELVGVAHVERHRRGQELDRIVRLHIGGLIGDQRIGRGVALVEAVVGEFRQQFEDRFGLARARRRARPRRRRSASRCASISLRIFLPMARRSRSASPS